MAGELTAHTVADFSDREGAGSYPLEITGDTWVGLADGKIRLLLFPPVNDPDPISVNSFIGEVVVGGTKAVDAPAGVVQFQGTNKASLPKRSYYSSPVFTVQAAFDLEGEPLKEGALKLTFDAIRNTLTASQPCYAFVGYEDYVTKATMLTYIPERRDLPGGGISIRMGVIAAFRKPSDMLMYTPQLIDLINGNSVIELYRITSPVIVTDDGQWEKPPNYPADGVYPSKTETIDPTRSLESKRTHEIGYMDLNGRGWSEGFTVIKAKPYVDATDDQYKIKTTCEVASLDKAVYPDSLQLKAKNFIVSRGWGCK